MAAGGAREGGSGSDAGVVGLGAGEQVFYGEYLDAGVVAVGEEVGDVDAGRVGFLSHGARRGRHLNLFSNRNRLLAGITRLRHHGYFHDAGRRKHNCRVFHCIGEIAIHCR